MGISVEDIKKLRDQTGAGMMKAKEALETRELARRQPASLPATPGVLTGQPKNVINNKLELTSSVSIFVE